MSDEKNGHYFKLEKYARFISRGVCDCGAVKFYADDPFDKPTLVSVERLNKRHGKKGNGHYAVIKNPSSKLGVKEESMENKLGEGLHGSTALVSPPEENMDGEKHAVQPRPDGKYTPEEKKLIAEEGHAAGSKTARRVIAEFYGIKPKVLHGWYMSLVANAGKHRKKELTEAKRDQLAKARAARSAKKAGTAGWPKNTGKTIEHERVILPAPEKPVSQTFYCPDDCQDMNKPCAGGNLKLTVDKAADVPYCPHYRAPEEKKAEPAAAPEPTAEKKATIDPMAIIHKLVNEGMDKALRVYEEKVKHFHELKASVLPRPRWYWVFFPGLMKHYLSTIERLVSGYEKDITPAAPPPPIATEEGDGSRGAPLPGAEDRVVDIATKTLHYQS